MKAKSKDSRMLTTSEVAHLLHVHPNTVRHWANEGLIHTYRLGRRGDRRFKRGDIDSLIGRNRHKPQ